MRYFKSLFVALSTFFFVSTAKADSITIVAPAGFTFSTVGSTITLVPQVVDVPSPSASIIPSPSLSPSSSPTVAPSLSPIPSPSPSPTPSSSLVTTTVAQWQNMTQVSPGLWRSNNLGVDQKCYIQLKLPRALQSGEHVRLTVTRKTNVLMDGKRNLKIERNWPSSTGIYSNDWDGRGLGTGSNELKAEEGTGLDLYNHGGSWNDGFYVYPQAVNTPVVEVREWWYSSAPGKADGHVRFTFGGVKVYEGFNWISDSASYSGTGGRQYYGPQCVYAPNSGDAGPLPAGSYVEFSNYKLEIVPN